MQIIPSTGHLRASRRGFTLIELLTVIAIIGILAAILIPTVGAVRRKAHQAKSVSNLRQLGTAIRAFAGDNKEILPSANYNTSNSGGGSWDEVILPYLGYKMAQDGTVSPAAEELFFRPGDKAEPNAASARRSYAMPRGAITRPNAGYWIGIHDTNQPFYRRGTPLSKVLTPSQVILLTLRRNNGNNSFVGSWTFADIGDVQAQIVEPEKTDPLSGGSLEFLFVDGSVKVLKPEDTWGKSQFGITASPKGYWPVHSTVPASSVC